MFSLSYYWLEIAYTLLFQSAVEAVEHGLSLWLPQLRNCNKSSTASAKDSVEVCV